MRTALRYIGYGSEQEYIHVLDTTQAAIGKKQRRNMNCENIDALTND